MQGIWRREEWVLYIHGVFHFPGLSCQQNEAHRLYWIKYGNAFLFISTAVSEWTFQFFWAALYYFAFHWLRRGYHGSKSYPQVVKKTHPDCSVNYCMSYCQCGPKFKSRYQQSVVYEGRELSHRNLFLSTRLIDQEETWRYTNGSEWC